MNPRKYVHPLSDVKGKLMRVLQEPFQCIRKNRHFSETAWSSLWCYSPSTFTSDFYRTQEPQKNKQKKCLSTISTHFSPFPPNFLDIAHSDTFLQQSGGPICTTSAGALSITEATGLFVWCDSSPHLLLLADMFNWTCFTVFPASSNDPDTHSGRDKILHEELWKTVQGHGCKVSL